MNLLSKDALRKEYKSKRQHLSEEIIKEGKKQAYEMLLPLVFSFSHVCSYMPIHKEVDVSLVNKELQEKGALCMVHIDSKGKVSIRKLHDLKDMEINPVLNFMQPKHSCPVCHKIDCFLVPGVVFDKFGGRLGYGFGFYDQILSKYKAAMTIGVCYDIQVFPKRLPQKSYDIKVDKLCIINSS